MSNAFPPPLPPPPSPDEHAQFVPVVQVHKVSWWTTRWLRTPVWAWIIVVLTLVGALGTVVANNGGKESGSPVATRPSGSEATETTAPQATPTSTHIPASTTPRPMASGSTTPAIVLPTVPLVTVAPGTTPPLASGSMSTAVGEWVLDTDLYGVFTDFTSDMQTVGDAAINEDYDGLGVACAAMHDTNEQLAATLPSPSPELTAAIQDMVDDFDAAMHYCQEGVANYDVDAIEQASEYVNRGVEHLNEMTTILNDLMI